MDGIYTMLRWLQKHKTNGVLTLADFGKALEDKKTYPPEMHEFLRAFSRQCAVRESKRNKFRAPRRAMPLP